MVLVTMSSSLMTVTLLIVAGYLLGSIPNGLLIARIHGVDLRKVGSGNIGATNVFRSIGRGWGLVVFFLDALKGFLPAFVFPRLLDFPPSWLGLACGMAAVCGHNWPVWLGFKGGKGVATSAGMLLGIAPDAAGIGFAVFAVGLAVTRIVSVGSILAAVAVPTAYFWLHGTGNRLVAGALTLMGVVVIIKHRSNIRRLLAGTEPRLFGRK